MFTPFSSPAAAFTSPLAPAPLGRERMELELELARRSGRPATLMAVAVQPPALDEAPPDFAARVRMALEAELRRAVEPAALHLWRREELVFALLSGRGFDEARALGEALVAAGRRLRVLGVEHELRAHVSVGLARDEAARDYWFEALLAVAEEGLELARTRGGEGVAHTELYTLCQRKVERAGPRRRVTLPDQPPPDEPPAPAPVTSAARASVTPLGPAEPGPSLDEALAAREREHAAEVERLERRIAKLMETLESTERELRALARRREAEPGQASWYREVQGLDDDDEHHGVKAALMERILEANLELREILREQRERIG